MSGEQHMDLSHNIYKRRLDIDSLRPIEEPQKQLSIGFASNKTDSSTTTTTSTTTEKPACGSCYGAETEERKCCNTCNEVRDAYRAKTWKFDPRHVQFEHLIFMHWLHVRKNSDFPKNRHFFGRFLSFYRQIFCRFLSPKSKRRIGIRQTFGFFFAFFPPFGKLLDFGK